MVVIFQGGIISYGENELQKIIVLLKTKLETSNFRLGRGGMCHAERVINMYFQGYDGI